MAHDERLTRCHERRFPAGAPVDWPARLSDFDAPPLFPRELTRELTGVRPAHTAA